MGEPRATIDQFAKSKFRTNIDISKTVEAGSVGEIIEAFVYDFSKNYIVENYGVDESLISYLPM